jgi:hypothetical protein
MQQVIIVVLIILIMGVGFIMIPLRAFFSFPTRTTIEKTTQKHDQSDMDHMKTERINEIAPQLNHDINRIFFTISPYRIWNRTKCW